MIDVVVGADEPLFLDGLARVIRQDSELQLVADLADGARVLAAIREHRPAVAVLACDASAPVLAAVVREALPTRVVLLDHAPGDGVWDVLQEGAAGVLARSASADAVRAAVRRVAGGGTALCEQAQSAVARTIRTRTPRELPPLSGREREVLQLVAAGLNAPEIARRLQVAVSTVRTHVQHLLDKLEAHDRAQLVRNAMRRGLID